MIDEITGRARGFVAECPELAILQLGPLAPDIHEHVEVCESCQLVLEVLATAALDDTDGCERFEPLLAARNDGTLGRAAANLLARHLASCEPCRAVADTLSASSETAIDHPTLPRVDPDAYALGLEVGRGGMGRVIAARDLRVGRPVAVKELLGRSRQLAARFEREARITARLQHPGIVPIYEIGRWPDGTPFYSMRMVDGRTLREAIGRASTLAERLALLPAVIAATEAVAFAHAQRIIHRDLTPSNVLVGAYGETVVIDWGLAKDVSGEEPDEPDAGPYRGEPAHAELTGAGTVIGTAAYMPPEQAHGEPVDERADVYALGATLYHLLAGAPPYTGTDVVAAVKAGPPPPIVEAAPKAPRDLQSIVTKAMARAPADRYPSARELAEELTRFQTGRMVEAHEYTTAERMRRFVARNRGALVVTGVALVVLAVLGVVAVRRVLRESAAARATLRARLAEEGRLELLDGDSQRALAYFDAAGDARTDPALQFMRATALREIATVERDLDCGGVVRDLAFGPDGTLYATCHDVAKAWRTSDFTRVAVLGPSPNGFDHIAFSHDGTLAVTYGGDGVARVWDVAHHHVLLHSLVHAKDSTITFATFTPDDAMLATTGYDGFARIWDVRTGAKIRDIQVSTALVFHHVYGVVGNDGLLLTFTIEGLGAGWKIATGEQVDTVEHGGFAFGGELSADGTMAATCGMNKLVKLWDTTAAATGARRLLHELAGATDAVVACKFSRDGRLVVGTSQDGHAYVWDTRTGATIAAVEHGGAVWTAHFSADGERFVTVGVGGVVKVWDTMTGGLLATHDTQGGQEAVFTPDGRHLIAGRGDGRIRVWADPTGSLEASYAWPAQHYLDAVTRDGRFAAIEDPAGWLVLRATATGAPLDAPRLQAPVAASDDRFAATTPAGRVLVVDTRGTPVAELAVAARPSALAFSADGRRVVVESATGAPEVWDVASRARVAALDGERHALASPDGHRAAAWRDDAPPEIWDVDAHARLAAPDIPVTARPAGFSHDGRRLVLYGSDDKTGTVTIVDLDGGDPRTIRDVIARPVLDPSARFVTMILADRRVLAHDLDDGGERGLDDVQFQQAQIDPRGQLIAAIDRLGAKVLVLDAEDGRVLARWPIAHEAPSIRQDGYDVPRAAAWWSPDGTAIIARSTLRVARWSADRATHDPTVIRDAATAAVVHRNLPWRVVGGKLVATRAVLRGRLTHGTEPVAGARLVLVFRKPADVGIGSITWSAAAYRDEEIGVLATDADGVFERAQLMPGLYTLTVVGTEHTRRVLVTEDASEDWDLDAPI